MTFSNLYSVVTFVLGKLETINIASLVAIVSAHKALAILVFFLAMVFEGETFLIIAGVLVHLGAFSVWEILGIAICGVAIGDMFWYFVGTVLRKIKKAEPMIIWLESIIGRLLPNFKEKPFISLVLAKYIYGTNHATLILSGVIGMNIWLFIKAEIVASLIWVFVFLSAGYFFGSVALLISHKVSVYLLLIVVFILIFMVAQRLFSRYYENKNKSIAKIDNL